MLVAIPPAARDNRRREVNAMPESSTSEKSPSERSPHGGGALACALLLVLVALPVLYVLSLGPAIWLGHNRMVNTDILQTIYSPLEWLYNNVEATKPLFDWYLSFWLP
jgi:hypothetical protein